MLLSKSTFIKWNSKNKRRYVDLGYTFTKMGDEFEVKTDDLSKGSNAPVRLKCDYCGREYESTWDNYCRRKKSTLVNKDCCGDCCELKAEESVMAKYGSYSNLILFTNEKRKETNLKKYGAENVFASEYGKNKIKETCLKKYGVPYSMQNDEVREKSRQTTLEKYGVEYYVELFKGKFIKENSPVWKGSPEYSRAERASHEYIQWRKAVFSRDSYTCQCCGDKSGRGHYVELHAHHIKNWKDNPDERYNLDNGITLCEKCHTRFHSKYGKHNTTREQLEDFLFLDEKIC